MKFDQEDIKTVLKKLGVTPTPVRLLVYKCLKGSLHPLSLNEIEEKLETVDKSSVSRTLNLFRIKHIVLYFDDGSGSVK